MQCKKCGLEKEETCFRTITVHNKKYKIKKCKQCEVDYVLKWQKDKKDVFKKIQKRYRENHREYFKLKNKKYQSTISLEKRKEYQQKGYAKISKEDRDRRQREFNSKFIEKYGISYATINTFGLKIAVNIYKKYNHLCAICNSNDVLCIHHKDGIGYGNYKKLNRPVNNKLDNLLLVCRKCHMIIHDNLHNFK